MEDEGYAQKLFAILTNPLPEEIDPEDPYGEGEDGIDRYNGFGRDVWVESVQVVDGEYGAELVVEFAPAPDSAPDAVDPRCGPVRLPFDAQWRELSGYGNPGAYAPAVAREVEIADSQHVERLLGHPPGHLEGDQDRAVLPSRARQWQLLLDALRHLGPVRQVGPERIELDHSGTVVTVLVSADQWEQVLIEHAWGTVDLYFAELLDPRQENETFVVLYWQRVVEHARAEDPDAQFRWDAGRHGGGCGALY